MQIVIDIDENIFTRLFDNGTEDYAIVNDDLFTIAKSIRNGTPFETQRPKGKWISVTERLPENTKDVLVFDGEDYFVAWYEAQTIEMQGWYSWDKSFDKYYSIKAWMPIEPYTEVKDEANN